MLDSAKYLTQEDEALEREAEALIQWTQELDFDKYADEWFFKSTIFINLDSNT